MPDKKLQIFSRRTLIVAGVKSFLLSILAGRLFYLQIIKSDTYKSASDKNRIKLQLIPPLRGKILDRHGEPLAINKSYYQIIYTPGYKVKGQEIIEKISYILSLEPYYQKKMQQKLKNHRGLTPLVLHDHLEWNEVAKIKIHAPDLPSISIDVGQRRFYTLGDAASHTLGYLGPVPEKEIQANPMLRHPDFKIGKNGIEQHEDNLLRGTVGVKHVEVNALGLPVRDIAKQESTSGRDLQLTINRDLQDFAAKALAGKSGSAVVIDTKNGEIITMASSPSFDPNQLSYGLTNEEWLGLINDLDKPLINKTISHSYAPGSTFKTIIALAALESGIDPNDTTYCTGEVALGNTIFRCWKKEGHGRMNMERAIMHSCNSYFYQLAKRININTIAKIAKTFDIGHIHPLPLRGQKEGVLPSPSWKIKTHNDKWRLGDSFNICIGQGYLSTTPLQLAVLAARLASGKHISPALIKHPTPAETEKLTIPEDHLALVRRGMFHVVNTPGGTAFGSRIADKSMTMAGKTGTTQVISSKAYKKREHLLTEEQKKRLQNHALFIGYAPYNDPRYAIAVVIEHGGGGSRSAAPVAKEILEKAQRLDMA